MADATESTRKRRKSRSALGENEITERRRAQQRLAQRAYRVRKEEESVNLRQRIDELEKRNLETSEAVLSFCKVFLESDLPQTCPDVVPALYHCLKVLKTNGLEKDDEVISPQLTNGVGSFASGNTEVWRVDRHENSVTTAKLTGIEPSKMTQDSSYVSSKDGSDSILEQKEIYKTPPNIEPDFKRVMDSQIAMSFPISAYISYSYHSPFAESLLNACFKKGYQLLTNSWPEPVTEKTIKKIFGSPFTPTDKERMKNYLCDAIDRTYACKSTALDFIPALSLDSWKPDRKVQMNEEEEFVNASNVQALLRARGVAVDDCWPSSQARSSADSQVRHFIEVLSDVPICVGSTVVFQKKQVYTALKLIFECAENGTTTWSVSPS